MERLPQVQSVCVRAMRAICSRLEEMTASASDLIVIQSVLSLQALDDVVDERFAQSKCGSLVCSNSMDKSRVTRSPIKFNETKGDFESASFFCSQKCSDNHALFRESLDPTPTFLRSDPVAKVMKAAKSLRVAADEMRELEKLAEPLLPKRIVIKEEQENSAPMGDANAVPFQNSDEHDVRELLDWDEVDKGNPDALKVQVPLVPIVWDLLSQWVTREAKWFVRTGEMPPVSSVADEEKPERAVADLSGHSLVKRQVRLSQALGPRIRSVLLECDVDDAEEQRIMIGRIDNLISIMNVTQERPLVAEGAKFDYSLPGNLFFSSKGLTVVAAVLVCVFRPQLIEKVAKISAKSLQRYELDMLRDLFQ